MLRLRSPLVLFKSAAVALRFPFSTSSLPCRKMLPRSSPWRGSSAPPVEMFATVSFPPEVRWTLPPSSLGSVTCQEAPPSVSTSPKSVTSPAASTVTSPPRVCWTPGARTAACVISDLACTDPLR